MQRKSCQTKNFYLRETDEKFSNRLFYLGSSAQRSEDTETQRPSLPPAVHAALRSAGPWGEVVHPVKYKSHKLRLS